MVLFENSIHFYKKDSEQPQPLGIFFIILPCYFKNPLTICSSASASVRPSVMSLIS